MFSLFETLEDWPGGSRSVHVNPPIPPHTHKLQAYRGVDRGHRAFASALCRLILSLRTHRLASPRIRQTVWSFGFSMRNLPSQAGPLAFQVLTPQTPSASNRAVFSHLNTSSKFTTEHCGSEPDKCLTAGLSGFHLAEYLPSVLRKHAGKRQSSNLKSGQSQGSQISPLKTAAFSF